MKKQKTSGGSIFRKTNKRKNPKIHSKSKTSKIKTSKNYKKKNVGQGK